MSINLKDKKVRINSVRINGGLVDYESISVETNFLLEMVFGSRMYVYIKEPIDTVKIRQVLCSFGTPNKNGDIFTPDSIKVNAHDGDGPAPFITD